GRQIGLVGCGRWGQLILRDLVQLGAVVHVADPHPPSRDDALTIGATSVCRAAAELPAVDGFVIAVPSSLHAEVVESVLDQLVPIFVEKPMTVDVASARRLVESAGERIFVMDKWRYLPGVRGLRDLVRDGRLGVPQSLHTTRVQWGNPHADVDGVWILAPHDLSIALEIFGEVPQPIAAVAHQSAGMLDLVGLLEVGAVSHHLQVSTRSSRAERRIELHGSLASAVVAGGWDNEISVYDSSSTGEQVCETISLVGESPLLAELRAFLTHLAGGPAPVSSSQDGLRIVEAIIELRRLAGLQ
ncbi:MAG: Gfo/Idh/MocA family oxidoreductase, partial [Actinobacteria bacterium]|nr:Gfo/Idh/MocA family oxidoreductase [Actinomycetota bacterium]